MWTFLDEARDPAVIAPSAIVVAGDADAPAVVEIVDIVPKTTGDVVHLRILQATSRTTLHSFDERCPQPDRPRRNT